LSVIFYIFYIIVLSVFFFRRATSTNVKPTKPNTLYTIYHSSLFYLLTAFTRKIDASSEQRPHLNNLHVCPLVTMVIRCARDASYCRMHALYQAIITDAAVHSDYAILPMFRLQ